MKRKIRKRGRVPFIGKIFAVFLAFIILFPFYWIVISSFKTSDTIVHPD